MSKIAINEQSFVSQTADDCEQLVNFPKKVSSITRIQETKIVPMTKLKSWIFHQRKPENRNMKESFSGTTVKYTKQLTDRVENYLRDIPVDVDITKNLEEIPPVQMNSSTEQMIQENQSTTLNKSSLEQWSSYDDDTDDVTQNTQSNQRNKKNATKIKMERNRRESNLTTTDTSEDETIPDLEEKKCTRMQVKKPRKKLRICESKNSSSIEDWPSSHLLHSLSLPGLSTGNISSRSKFSSIFSQDSRSADMSDDEVLSNFSNMKYNSESDKFTRIINSKTAENGQKLKGSFLKSIKIFGLKFKQVRSTPELSTFRNNDQTSDNHSMSMNEERSTSIRNYLAITFIIFMLLICYSI